MQVKILNVLHVLDVQVIYTVLHVLDVQVIYTVFNGVTQCYIY